MHHIVQLPLQQQESQFCSGPDERVCSALMLLQILNAELAALFRNAEPEVERENPDCSSLSCAFPCSCMKLIAHLRL